MVKFNVLKEEITSRVFDFKIPLQVILEDDEKSLGFGYLEDELKKKMREICFNREVLWAEGVDKLIICFKKEEVPKLQEIIKNIKKNLESIIQKYVGERRKREKQEKESKERKIQELREIKEKLYKIDFS